MALIIKSSLILLTWNLLNMSITCEENVCLKTTPQNTNVDLKVGEDLNLECQLTGCKSGGCDKLEANWWKEEDDEPRHHGKTYSKEYVLLVDAGEYTCVIQYRNEPYEGNFSVHIEDISMEKYPKELQVNMTKGSSLVLFCQLCGCPREGCGHYTISWTKPEYLAQLAGKSNFTLNNVRYENSGVYTCNTVVKGQTFEEFFDVFVEGDLHIKTNPEVKIVNVAHGTDELQLECELIGCSRQGCTYIHFTWEKGGNKIAEGKSLLLERITYNDTATYICKTKYAGQRYNKSFQVQVYGKPDGTPVITPHNLVSVVLVNIELTCNTSGIDRGVPAGVNYEWFKNRLLQTGENKQHYSFTPQNVTNRDAFACVLQNKHGSSLFGSTNVSVEAPPFIESPATNHTYQPRYNSEDFNVSYIISGSNLTNLTLKNSNREPVDEDFTIHHEPVYGHHKYGQTEAKKVTLKWKLDATDLTSCDGFTHYNGHYTIEAMGTAANLTYRDNSTFNIQVQYPAIWRKPFQNETSQMCVPKTLYCDVCAEPAPTNYRWSFMGEELGNTTGPELLFMNVSKEEFGIYTCTVENGVGTRSFNISMMEYGFVHHPEKVTTVSQTSKTLLLSWEAKMKECYDLEFFEIRFRNGTLIQNIPYSADHCEMEKCNYRVKDLWPQTKYGLQMRAKYDWSDDDRSYSKYAAIEGITSASPVFMPLEPSITETSIKIRWKYGDKQVYIIGEDDEVVTVVIYYKVKDDSHYIKFPKSGRIPAENESAIIPGKFDKSIPHIFEYHVFEGNQLAVKTDPREKMPDDRQEVSVNIVVVLLPIVGTVIGVGVLCLLVGLWWGKKKRHKHDSGLPTGPSAQRNASYDDNNYEKLGSAGMDGSEYTELQHITDISYDDVSTELSQPPPNYETLNKTGSEEAQYMDLKDKSGTTKVSCGDVPTELAPLPPNHTKLTGAGSAGAQQMDKKDKSGDDYEHAYEWVA